MRKIIFYLCIFVATSAGCRIVAPWELSCIIGGIVSVVVICDDFTKGKFTSVFVALCILALGVAVLKYVFDDLIKAIAVVVGIFLTRAGLDDFLREVGNPDAKIMKYLKKWYRKRQETGRQNTGSTE